MSVTTHAIEELDVDRPETDRHEPARRDGSLRDWWSDTLVFAWRNIEHIRQIPEKLLDVTLQPLMFVMLFAYVFGGAIAVRGGNYREYIVAGILTQSLAFGLTGPATAIATDLTEGVIDRFRSLPVASACAVCCAKIICSGIVGRQATTISSVPNAAYCASGTDLARKCTPHVIAPPAMLAIISQPLWRKNAACGL